MRVCVRFLSLVFDLKAEAVLIVAMGSIRSLFPLGPGTLETVPFAGDILAATRPLAHFRDAAVLAMRSGNFT